ncbi:MAG: YgjV family protein [Anaerovoracaceae bacterium]|jgi:hypothetical protein
MHMILIQLIGFLGLLFFLISYQVRTNHKLFAAQTGGNLTFMIQFILLHAYSGCLNLALGVARNIMLMGYNKSRVIRWKGWPVLFTAAYAAVTWVTWRGWTSLLPFAAMTSCTIAYWTNNARLIRAANLFCACPCWIIYDSWFHSIAGVLNESITMLSILISIWRFGWKAMGDPNSGFED